MLFTTYGDDISVTHGRTPTHDRHRPQRIAVLKRRIAVARRRLDDLVEMLRKEETP